MNWAWTPNPVEVVTVVPPARLASSKIARTLPSSMIPLYDDQPTRSFPTVTLLIIMANVLVFMLWQLDVGLSQSVQRAALVPAELSRGEGEAVAELFSSMFMHAGWMHLIGNMWFLWIFGNNIEDITGHFQFLMFYLGCGVAAAAAHVMADPASVVPVLGASGAVSGVLGAYFLKHPQARVRTLVPLGLFIRIIDVPAFLFLLIWIGLQIVFQAAASVQPGRGGVAYLAHIGGFVAGMMLIFLFQKVRDLLPAQRDNRW